MPENKNDTENLGELLKIRRDKLTALQEAGEDPFEITKFEKKNNTQEIRDNFEAMEEKPVQIAETPDVQARHGEGDLLRSSGSGRPCAELDVRRDEVGEEPYKTFKKYDIGDIVGVDGVVFRTQRGEISVRAMKVTLLSKSLLPLPEKFHGLTNHGASLSSAVCGSDHESGGAGRPLSSAPSLSSISDGYLDNAGYIEVETPVLNTISGGASARPFITHHNTLDIDMYLRIATELHLKRLIVGGMERVYEVGRIFRNEGMDPKHNPEFTTVELYEAYADFNDMMDLFEDLLSGAAEELLGTTEVTWMGEEISLKKGWPRMTMAEAVRAVCWHRLYGH